MSRTGTLKLGSVHPAKGLRDLKRMIMNEQKQEDQLQEDLEHSLKQRDLTGNNPLHLAIVMSGMSRDLEQRKDAKDFVCYFMECIIQHLHYDTFLELLLEENHSMLRPLDFMISPYQNINDSEVPWYQDTRGEYIKTCNRNSSSDKKSPGPPTKTLSENIRKSLTVENINLSDYTGVQSVNQVNMEQLDQFFSQKPFWRTDLVLVFPEHHSRFFLRFWKWMRFPLIEKYYDIYKMNCQIHEEEEALVETHSGTQKKKMPGH